LPFERSVKQVSGGGSGKNHLHQEKKSQKPQAAPRSDIANDQVYQSETKRELDENSRLQ
jgi:hypothetical protein